MFIIFLIPVILGFVCAKKESKVTSLYSSFGVYGRFYAYITISLLLGSLMVILGGIFTVLVFRDEYEGIALVGVFLYVGVIALALAFFGFKMYRAAKKRCPEGLRRRLFRSMLVTAWGCGMKIVLFFLPMIWELTAPSEVVDSNGNELTVLGTDVYDSKGNRVGTVTGRGMNSITIERR